MVSSRSVVSGRQAKGDVEISISLENGSLHIDLQSSVKALFGTQITHLIEESLLKANVEHASVQLKDHGALNHIILARLEAALAKLDITFHLYPKRISFSPSSKTRLRRSRLYIPGNQPDLALNAGLYGADCIILDLEDSVAPESKHDARYMVRNSLMAVDFQYSERIVRINPFSSFGKNDLEVILPAQPDIILVPKCETAGDVKIVHDFLIDHISAEAPDSPPFLMPLIETTQGALNAQEIATASEKNVALCFGAEDFTASLGTRRTQEGRESFVARSLIVMAARAAGIQALDTVYSDIENMDGLEESTRDSVSLGFDGRGLIHPAQIRPVHRVFTPSQEEIEQAKAVIQALDQAKERASGVATLGSKMIDAPVVARAERTLHLARAMGLLED